MIKHYYFILSCRQRNLHDWIHVCISLRISHPQLQSESEQLRKRVRSLEDDLRLAEESAAKKMDHANKQMEELRVTKQKVSAVLSELSAR